MKSERSMLVLIWAAATTIGVVMYFSIPKPAANNGARSAASNNGARSAASDNGAHSAASDNGAHSAASDNGARSAASDKSVIYDNAEIWRQHNLGTLIENSVPYPVSCPAFGSAPFTIPLPPGSNVTSGSWNISNMTIASFIAAPDGTSRSFNSGVTVMNSSEINGINSGGIFYLQLSYTGSVNISVNLTGTFPSVNPVPGLEQGVWQPSKTTLMQQNIITKKDRCRMQSRPIFVYNDISLKNFPMIYQFVKPDKYKWLSINCGLANIGGANGNASINMRIYKGRVADDNTWLYSPLPPDPEPTPLYTGLFTAPVIIPWDSDLIGYLKFTSFLSAAPAGSNIELLIQPFNQ